MWQTVLDCVHIYVCGNQINFEIPTLLHNKHIYVNNVTLETHRANWCVNELSFNISLISVVCDWNFYYDNYGRITQ